VKRAAVVLLIALAAAVAARVAVPAHQRHVGLSAGLACGVERWSIKTLKDRPRLLRARPATVAYLTGLPRPTYLPARRRLLSRTMIAEAPSPLCTSGATPIRRKQMIAARKAGRVCAKARLVGVAFFDFLHGQTGVARNGIELHPILGFACLSTGKVPPPPPPPAGKCAASYPTVCIPPPPPDLDCGDIPFRNFRVRWDVPDPDPHCFDGDRDGIGCET
jgi:hypothetical protein